MTTQFDDAGWDFPPELARSALRAAGSAVFVTDAEGTILWVNDAFTELTGWSAVEAVGENPRILQSGLQDVHYYARLWTAIKSGHPFSSTVVNRTKAGALFTVAQTVTPLPRGSRRPTHFVAFQEDIREEVARAREMEYLAYSDALTTLGNRRAALERLATVGARRETAAVLLLDLDEFKQINDRFGHDQGDAALRDIATALRATLPGVPAFRLGGDEFVAILPEKDNLLREVDLAVRRIRDAVALVNPPGTGIQFGVTVGCALVPRDGRSPSDLLRAADIALRRAKAASTGFAVYQPEWGSESARELRLTVDLQYAALRGQIHPHYQPICDLHSGRVTSFEALARWVHPLYGQVEPSEFIPLAERCGQISAVGRAMLALATGQRAWAASRAGVRLAVNVSPSELADALFPARLRRTLETCGFPPGLLDLEITESSDLEHPIVRRVINQLARLGVGLVIDDLGAGFSRLSYIADFPVTAIKLDKTFVQRASDSEGHRTLIKKVIEGAQALGVRVIGEGIETPLQLSILRDAGCDEGQGYLFGRAQPIPQRAVLAS